jgi:hypothetical protein
VVTFDEQVWSLSDEHRQASTTRTLQPSRSCSQPRPSSGSTLPTATGGSARSWSQRLPERSRKGPWSHRGEPPPAQSDRRPLPMVLRPPPDRWRLRMPRAFAVPSPTPARTSHWLRQTGGWSSCAPISTPTAVPIRGPAPDARCRSATFRSPGAQASRRRGAAPARPAHSGGGAGPAAGRAAAWPARRAIREGRVSWQPAMDVNRIALQRRLVATISLPVVSRLVRRRRDR